MNQLKYILFSLLINTMLSACTAKQSRVEERQTQALADLYTQSEHIIDLITLPLAYYCRYAQWPSQEEFKGALGENGDIYLNLTALEQGKHYVVHYKLKNKMDWIIMVAKPDFFTGQPEDVSILLKSESLQVEQDFPMRVECKQHEIIFY